MKRFFKNCDIQFTKSERIGYNTLTRKNEYKFETIKKENVFIRTDSRIKSIDYLDLADGINWVRKRAKSLKIIGGEEITLEQMTHEIQKGL